MSFSADRVENRETRLSRPFLGHGDFLLLENLYRKQICHTVLLRLLVICDLLVTHHPPEQASYRRTRSDQIWFSS
jgi:hypothetical protein